MKLKDFSFLEWKIRIIGLSAILVLIVFGVHSCSDDFFQNYGNPFDRDTFKEIATGTIGVGGGVIEADSVKIVIPPGAFDEDAKLILYINKRDTTFGDHGLTPMYKVSGFPATVNLPLEFTLPYAGAINGDTLVALGEEGFATSLDTTHWAYHSHPAGLSQGLVGFTYPAGQTKTSLVFDMLSELKFLLIDGYTRRLSSGKHFNVAFPLDQLAGAMKLGSYFELAYDTCAKMGFVTDARTWPVDVMVKNIDYLGVYTTYIADGDNPTDLAVTSVIDKGRFTINLQYLNNDKELLFTATHEYFHMIQNLYEFSAPWAEPHQSWFMEATSVWFEHKFSADPNYMSSAFINREHYIFNGLQGDSAAHGYGLPYVISDLVEHHGKDIVRNIFEKVKAGNIPGSTVDPVEAILAELKMPVSQYWHGLLGSFVLGEYFGGAASYKILDNPNMYLKTYTVDKSLVKETAAYHYKDLSGAFFKLILSEPNWPVDSKLKFSVSPAIDCGLMVCKFKASQEISVLKEVFPGGDGIVIVEDLSGLQQAGYELVVMVSNTRNVPDYTSTQVVELNIELNPDDPPDEKAPELDLPNSINLSYWDYLRLTTSDKTDPVFYMKLKEVPVDYSTIIRVYDKKDQSWFPLDAIGKYYPDSAAFKGNVLVAFLKDLLPDTQESILIQAENDFGKDSATVYLNILPLFDGIAVSDSAGRFGPLGEMAACVESRLEFSLGGSSLEGNISKQYFCPEISPNSSDTINWITSIISLTMAANQDLVTGSCTILNEFVPKKREWAQDRDLKADEVEASTSFNFSSKIINPRIEEQSPSAGAPYQFSFGFDGVSSTTTVRRVFYRAGDSDSINVETFSYNNQGSFVEILGDLKKD
ncbi:MAG: hypothetical protein U9N86_18785 [Bacteroidota bacterium]|nr:hypothetical protein [Bacteroidota bacterium]